MKKRAKKAKADAGRSSKAVDLQELRRKLAARVANRAPEMVTAVIEEVMKGEHQPMKYLFEMIGLYPEREMENSGGDALAKTLLQRLHFPEDSLEKSEEEEVASS